MKNKILFSLFAITICITSCKSVRQIGKMNMLSTRNINTETKYELLSSYTGGTKKQLKKSKEENIEHAITNTVKKVPGGEFMMNVTIYQI